MKLYDGGRAPNPRRVRIFLAEKGMSVPMEPVNLGALELNLCLPARLAGIDRALDRSSTRGCGDCPRLETGQDLMWVCHDNHD